VDAAICLGVDTLTDMVIAAYRGLGVIAGEDNGDGLALAEAGLALLVERQNAAGGRGARSYGDIRGFGITSDGLGVAHVDRQGNGVERAMRLALQRAGVRLDEVVAVWASRCGLHVVDEAEAAAVERVFGPGMRLIAPKVRLGEPMGAGGALNVALALLGWQRGDETASPRGPILVNSLSLGGANVSICLAPAA
jgi:3-oxoacyl-[acyl-carrier-protein] synthase II